MLRKHDPSLSTEAIALLPIVAALVYQDNISKVRAISHVAAKAYGVTVQEALETDFAYKLPDCILSTYSDIMEHAAWRNKEAAGYETILRRGDGRWYQCVGLIVGPSDIVHWTAAPTAEPSNTAYDIAHCKVLILDELVL